MGKPALALFTLAGSLFLPFAFGQSQHVSYTYDAAGRLAKVDYGNGQTISYAYDNAGNLVNVQQTAATTQASNQNKRPANKKHAKERKHAN